MSVSITKYLDQLQIAYKENEPLRAYTSFKIGGPCEVLMIPKSKQEIKQAVQLCKEQNTPYLILGNGSNVLVSDQGYRGAVILLNSRFSEITLPEEHTVYAQAGASLSKLCVFAQQHGLTGLEFAYGIPATVGGAVYMNAGAYGGETKDVLQYVHYLDENGTEHERPVEELEMAYRHSFFSNKGHCILGAGFALTPGDPAEIRKNMDDIYGRRKDKQPLEFPSAGSTFKRPQGAFAAALIQDSGLKGCQVGGAQVSEKHSGFVINRDGATCADVLALVEKVKRVVKEKTGFELECEIKMIE